MKAWYKLGLSLLMVGVIALAACRPAPVPSPATPAPPAAPLKAAPASNLPPSTSQEASWSRIVEAARKEGKITAYSYAWVGDAGLAVEKAFERRYGIDMEIITGTGAQFHERMKTEKRMGKMVADMTEGSSLLVNNMKLDGLLVSVAADLPSLQEKDVWAVSPLAFDPKDQVNLWWRQNVYTPYINTKLVKLDEVPKTWKELLDPRWKGKMTLTEPKVGAGAYQYIVVFLRNKVWDEEFIRALYKQDLKFPRGLPDEFRMLAAGESYLAIRGSDATAASFAAQGAPIQAIDMKEGTVLSSATVAAIAGGPHPNAAKVFLSWLLFKEGQSVAGQAQSNRMVRNDVPDFRPKSVQVPLTNPLVESLGDLQKATELFRENWYDKLVGR